MNGREIKSTLKNGGMVFGMMLTHARTMKWGAVLAGGGIDYAIIDTEHSQRSRAEISDLVVMLKGVNIASIVRVPFPVPHYVAMALDAGADGVLVPYCEDLDEIRQCAAVKRWHPMKGAYLRRAMDTGQFASDKSREYLENRHKDHILIIGIESEPAFNKLDQILEIGGIDAMFVGPNDMSTSLGAPDDYANPRYWEVITTIIGKAAEHGLPTMVHQQNIPDSTKAISLGARFILHSSDGRQLQNQMQHDFTAIRDAAGKTLGATTKAQMEDTVETV